MKHGRGQGATRTGSVARTSPAGAAEGGGLRGLGSHGGFHIILHGFVTRRSSWQHTKMCYICLWVILFPEDCWNMSSCCCVWYYVLPHFRICWGYHDDNRDNNKNSNNKYNNDNDDSKDERAPRRIARTSCGCRSTRSFGKRSAAVGPLSMWGFDYEFTDYIFRRELFSP